MFSYVQLVFSLPQQQLDFLVTQATNERASLPKGAGIDK